MRKLLTISILLLSLFLLSNCTKDICQSGFIKERSSKSKSSVFKEVKFTQTKDQLIIGQHNREMRVAFKKSNEDNIILIRQFTKRAGFSFKRQFVLGDQIKIGFIFEDKLNYILAFQGSENYQFAGNRRYIVSFNEIKIDSTLNNLLKNKKIISFEIMNPFGQINETKVRKWDIYSGNKKGEKIMQLYSCFLNK